MVRWFCKKGGLWFKSLIMLDLGGIFAQSSAWPGQYLGSVIEMPLCGFPPILWLWKISPAPHAEIPAHNFLPFPVKKWDFHTRAVSCAVSLFSSSGNFQIPLSLHYQYPVWWGGWHLQMSGYLQALWRHILQPSFLCKIFLTLPPSHSSPQARSPGTLLNKTVLTYRVSGDCTKELSSAFRNKLLTHIFLVCTQFFPCIFTQNPSCQAIKGKF